MRELVKNQLDKVHNQIKLCKFMVEKYPTNEKYKEQLALAYKYQATIHSNFPQYLV